MMNSIRTQLQSMLAVDPRPGGYRATLKVRHDFSILPDHFPNAPILPGICLVQAVLIAGAIALDLPELRLGTLKNAKMVHPIFPGDEVVIDADIVTNAPGQFVIKSKIMGDGKRRAEISLTARAEVLQEAIPA